ncbi:MAG TPA: DUF1553 domain-containing protein [Planctomycetes bacterium]|nr:DUF1553 domain-containing protein [Planctomycetota bacterium]
MSSRVFSVLLLFAIALAGKALLAAEPTAAELEHFEKRVRPILVSRCYDCHSEESVESNLRVDSLAGLLRGGKRGAAIVPGKPEKSLMIFAINHATQLDMPPKTKLPVAEIAALTRWVKMGAPWPNAKPLTTAPALVEADEIEITAKDLQFWSFHPPTTTQLPSVRRQEWPRNAIDHFVLAKLEAAGLQPAPAASRTVWLRRVTYDLIGLPPTVDEMNRFLQDTSPAAVQRVVDALLSSPAYGERWGRRWLDVARYADSNGLDENLAYANAFHYRDYVVDSFNEDKPYSHFVLEQLAGDLMTDQDSLSSAGERITATGFLSLGAKMLAEDDPVKMQMDIIDEQVDTIGKAFMGLSIGCARCHNHKFDPISMTDYYGLAGIFKSTRTMENFKVVARWQERPVESSRSLQDREQREQQVSEAETEIAHLRREAAQTQQQQSRQRVGDYLMATRQLKQFVQWLPNHTTYGNQPELLASQPTLMLEAEQYQRGNVLKDKSTYGKSIGVLVNRGELPNFVEYDIELPAEGWYQLEVRYAAETARPTKLFVDGQLIRTDLAGGITGSWQPDTQTWSVAAVIELSAGKHLLRLEHPQFFPHIDKLLLVRLTTSRAAENKSDSTTLLNFSNMISLEAETFHRGNVVRLSNGYGVGIGVIAGPGGANWVEMDFQVPQDGTYYLAVRYAAAEARPTQLKINGQLVNGSLTDEVTGSWYPDTQKWVWEGSYQLTRGKVTLRLDRAGPIPHIDRFCFIPVNSLRSVDQPPVGPSSLAAGFVDQWQTYLEKQSAGQDEVFGPWFAAIDGRDYQPASPLATQINKRLVGKKAPESLAQWANRYQQLFALAETQWQQASGSKQQVSRLEDAVLEACRQVLYDPQGPFMIRPGLDYGLPAESQQRLVQLRTTIDELKKVATKAPMAMAVSDAEPEDLQIHLRGSHISLGRKVPRRFLQVISGRDQPAIGDKQSGRLQLARWLVSEDHPLTARVIVNRIWQGHFGTGLVRSPDNFGRLGQLPTHPQLLDYLALHLKRNQWSLKTLHRQIVLSATYRMSSRDNRQAALVDPDNKLYWRVNRRRLEAEAIRDAVLVVGGSLDRRMGGSELMTENRKYVTSTANVNPVVYQNKRRSIYLPVVRSALFEMFQVFDFSDPSVLNGKRQTTTIAPQALFMMNSKVVVDECQSMARNLLSASELNDKQRIQRAFQMVYTRSASELEISESLGYMDRYQKALEAQEIDTSELRQRSWQSLCHALIVASEFIYLE